MHHIKITIIYGFSSKLDMYPYLHTASACRKSAPPTEPPVRIRSSLENVSLKKDKRARTAGHQKASYLFNSRNHFMNNQNIQNLYFILKNSETDKYIYNINRIYIVMNLVTF